MLSILTKVSYNIEAARASVRLVFRKMKLMDEGHLATISAAHLMTNDPDCGL